MKGITEVTDHEARIARATAAVDAYYKQCGWGDYEEVLGDMLADLMHYVDALRVDREIGSVEFDDLLDTARMHYRAETQEPRVSEDMRSE